MTTTTLRPAIALLVSCLFLSPAAAMALSLGLLGLGHPAQASPAQVPDTGQGLFEHSYYDCRKRSGGSCRRFYSVEKDRIAVVLKDPQLAHKVPEVARGVKLGGKTLAELCGSNSLLEFETLDKESPEMAAYELSGCRSEGEALWLARQLSEASEMDSLIKITGILVRHASEPGRFLLVDEILVQIAEEIPLPISNDHRALLEVVGLEFRAVDPFDPRRGLVRAIHKDSPTQQSPLDGLELLACALSTKHKQGDPVAECLKEYGRNSASAPSRNAQQVVALNKAYKRALNALGGGPSATPGDALVEFLSLSPRLLRPTLLPVAPQGIRAGFGAWLEAEQKKEDDLSTSIAFDSTSNETRDDDSARLKVKAVANKGTYPGQLRTTLGAQVEFGNEKFQENVTNLEVNYDHYLRPWLEVYGFVERFSNSFLGIDQRWEGGGGMLVEGEWRTAGKDTFCYRLGLTDGYRGAEVKVTDRARVRLEQWRARVREELLRQGSVSNKTAADYCKYHPGIVKRNAVFQYSLAFSIFADFEQPEAITIQPEPIEENGDPLPDAPKPDSMDLRPASSEWGRLTIRPMVTWRPSNDIEVQAWYYIKLALDSDEELDNGRQDRRTELALSASLGLSQKDPKVSLTGKWTRREDTQPPLLSAAMVHEQFNVEGDNTPTPLATTFDGKIEGTDQLLRFTGFSAERRHTVVEFGVKVDF